MLLSLEIPILPREAIKLLLRILLFLLLCVTPWEPLQRSHLGDRSTVPEAIRLSGFPFSSNIIVEGRHSHAFMHNDILTVFSDAVFPVR